MVGVSGVAERVFAAEAFSVTSGLEYEEAYAIVGGLALEADE